MILGKCPSGGFFGIKKTPSQLTGCFLLLVTFLLERRKEYARRIAVRLVDSYPLPGWRRANAQLGRNTALQVAVLPTI
jgi:hypothetical protein